MNKFPGFRENVLVQIPMGAGCTCVFGGFCECSGSGSGLHLRFRRFLRVQWRIEQVALAFSGIFASVISQLGACKEDAAGGYGVRRLMSAAPPPLDDEERRLRSGELRRPRPTGGLLARRAVPVPGRGRAFFVRIIVYCYGGLLSEAGTMGCCRRRERRVSAGEGPAGWCGRGCAAGRAG